MATAAITPIISREYGRSRIIPRIQIWTLFFIFCCLTVYALLLAHVSHIYESTMYKDMGPLSAGSFSHECHCRMEEGDKDRAKVFNSLILEEAPSGAFAEKDTHDKHPNIELNLLLAREKTRHCNLLPSLLELAWRDVYWQAYPAGGEPQFLFYAAYLDDRLNAESKVGVRILAMAKETSSFSFFCQFWRNEVHPPVWASVASHEPIPFVGGEPFWIAHVILCHIPDQLMDPQMFPTAVSVSATPCGRPSVLLKIVGASEMKLEALNRVSQDISPSNVSTEPVNHGTSVPEAQERRENLNNDSKSFDSIFRNTEAGMKPLGAAEIVEEEEEEEKADVVHGASAAMTRPSWERKEYVRTLSEGGPALGSEHQLSFPSDWRVGVCGPALYYYNTDFSLRLVEWAEVLKHLGVSKVFLYEYDGGSHPNLSKVLRHYENEGFFSVKKFSYPSPYLAYPPLKGIFTNHEREKKFSIEHIYFTDCILRNMRDFRFLAHFDPDEIPILPNHNTLPELIKDLYVNKTKDVRGALENMPSGYKLRWRFFFDHFPAENGAPSYTHALRMPWRLENGNSRLNGKCIYDTRQIISVVSHNPTRCLSGACPKVQWVLVKKALLGHFRECWEGCEAEKYLQTKDETLIKKRKVILPGIIKALRELGLLGS